MLHIESTGVQWCETQNKGFHGGFEAVVDLLAWLLGHLFLKNAVVSSYRCESCLLIFSMGK